MSIRIKIASALLVLSFIAFSAIVLQGRPVVDLKKQLGSQATSATTQSSGSTTGTSNGTLAFSMAEVQSHNSKENCWSAINGSVYDLTTWVSRHPGGANVIIGLCGIDGTAQFNARHSRSKAAQAALGLFFIGKLN